MVAIAVLGVWTVRSGGAPVPEAAFQETQTQILHETTMSDCLQNGQGWWTGGLSGAAYM